MSEDRRIFEELEGRLRTLLPEEYQDRYEDVQPVSMGSAGVRYGADGRIAWDQMWGSFCDLAIAGGPPHKGSLLLPGSPDQIAASPDRYQAVVAEICRGIGLVTELGASPSPAPGWIRIECLTRGMAGWLLRAISMENVAVRADDLFVELPAGPAYRDLKEIKNVITVIAKTAHYWLSHMPVMQRQAITTLIEGMNAESPLVAPDYRPGADAAPWRGIECPSIREAVWMMRMMVTVNVLARREGTTLFLPVNPIVDPDGEIVASSLALVQRLARTQGVRLDC
jgi:sirohydrochlorin cobaltochelatase